MANLDIMIKIRDMEKLRIYEFNEDGVAINLQHIKQNNTAFNLYCIRDNSDRRGVWGMLQIL
jgi:hypothetical protein